MTAYASDVAFTPTVKSIQEAKGSRDAYARMEQRSGWRTAVTPDLETFLSKLDMFYLGTANADGRPYVQYRGGPAGFLKALDDKTLGFADFGGNRQYVTLGNLEDNSKAFLFLMDYETRTRIKVWGKARVIENDDKLIERLSDSAYAGKPERAILFEIEAWDINCPQHIHARVRVDKVAAQIDALKARIRELETKLADVAS